MLKKILLPGIAALVFFSACKKETEDYKSPTISEYAPLQVGKYITYQLDSVRYPPFSTLPSQLITISYQVKFLVDAEITDNLGRPAFRVVRFIRKDDTQAWAPDNSFTAINAGDSYEFVDNNLRFVKMRMPIKTGFTWKGNSFINTTSQYSDFVFLDSWDYTYDSLDAPLTLGPVTVDSTIKIAQRDEVLGNPDDLSIYTEINYGTEYYAKGIGLVYKRFFHSIYQPPPPPPAVGEGYFSSDSKGYTLTMIDHN